MTDAWCRGVVFPADVIFNFIITYRSPALFGSHYSSYQLFLYQTISEHREKEITFNAIAEWFNKEGYLTLRGKRFKGAHVHSILRKRLAKEELLKGEYPAIWSNFSLEVVDKTILMSDSGSFSFCIKKVQIKVLTLCRGCILVGNLSNQELETFLDR